MTLPSNQQALHYQWCLELKSVCLPSKCQKLKIVVFANSEDSDEVAHNEPAHLGLHCLPSTSDFLVCLPSTSDFVV